MKKRQRDVRLIRAGIQLAFFIVAPSLFSTAFAGVDVLAGFDCELKHINLLVYATNYFKMLHQMLYAIW